MDPNAAWRTYMEALEELEAAVSERETADEWEPELDQRIIQLECDAREALTALSDWMAEGGFRPDEYNTADVERLLPVSEVVAEYERADEWEA